MFNNETDADTSPFTLMSFAISEGFNPKCVDKWHSRSCRLKFVSGRFWGRNVQCCRRLRASARFG